MWDYFDEDVVNEDGVSFIKKGAEKRPEEFRGKKQISQKEAETLDPSSVGEYQGRFFELPTLEYNSFEKSSDDDLTWHTGIEITEEESYAYDESELYREDGKIYLKDDINSIEFDNQAIDEDTGEFVEEIDQDDVTQELDPESDLSGFKPSHYDVGLDDTSYGVDLSDGLGNSPTDNSFDSTIDDLYNSKKECK